MEAIEEHILDLVPTGGTNMEAGMALGTQLLAEHADADPEEFENRMIFMTDAMPNTGDTSEGSLLDMVYDNGEANLFTTFVGIGLDFNSSLIDAITKARGANYFSVHSETEFNERLDDEFELMVTPLVFELQLSLSSEAATIDTVLGSPEADESTGEIMYVRTLFPSRTTDGETRGGIVLLRLDVLEDAPEIALDATWEDRSRQASSSSASLVYDPEPNVAPNTGVRKAILLGRYASLAREWIAFERAELGLESSPEDPSYWERESIALVVSESYAPEFAELRDHFASEMNALGDESLARDLAILELLADWQP
jgi:Ca-activated chloride channel family protein